MSVIEITTFRLEGSEEKFLASDERLQAELSGRPGIIRRTTARGASGGWLVLTLWRSEGEADASGDLPDGVDTSSVERTRYAPLS